MADVKDEVEELEELLVGLENESAMEAYSEDDDVVTLSMAAPIGDQEWMVQLSPTNRKMMSTDRVVIELGLGTLNDATLVWRGGMEEWMPIGQVEDLTRARSSVPPPRPAPAPVPSSARVPSVVASAGDDEEPAQDAMDSEASAGEMKPEDDGDSPTPLVPPAPAMAASQEEAAPPPPRSYTARPVAVDFSAMPPKKPASLRMVLGAGGAAAAMVVVTLFSLSRGGVFETTKPAPEARSVSSLEPAPMAAAAPVATPAPAPAVAAPAAAAPEPAAAPVTPPESSAAEPAAAVASDDEPASEESKPVSPWAKPRAKARKRVRTAKAAAETSGEMTEEPAPRAKISAARSKTRNVVSKASAEEPAEEARETAPAPGPTVGFNRQAAQAALKDAAAQAGNCRPAGGPTGNGKVQVRYDASGKVGAVSILTPGFENTTTGSCIQMVFRRAKIASFSGAPVTLTESFEIK